MAARISMRATHRGPQAITLLAIVVVTLLAQSATAQRPTRYQPSRPTVSPYLNLLRNNVSPLPNYYSLVRPQQQQINFNNQQRALQIQQNRQLRSVQSGLIDIQLGPTTGTPSGHQQPGRRYQFLGSDRYFQPPRGR